MNGITRRLSVPELSQQILEMAKTGVYRESVFEALQPMATKTQIRKAIAHAKRFGLHSVATLRDAELGTYYQTDWTKYQASQALLHSPAHFGEDAELVDRVTQATQAVDRMLTVARRLAGGLAIAGLTCWFIGQPQIGTGLVWGSISVAGLWALQRTFLKKIS